MLRLSIVGDVRINNEYLLLGEELRNELQNSDVNVMNYEAPIKASNYSLLQKSGPRLSQNEQVIDTLVQSGFNVISMANNHAMDFGEESLLYTKSLLEKHNCLTLGAGSWEDTYQIKYVEKHGVRIGFLAVTQHEFGVLDEEYNGKDQVGTAWMLHPCIDELIVEGRKQCDYLFVLPHAGIENEYYPLPELRTLYRHWINMGADGVFASHPHTPQGWEMYNNKPICYSLGNFCFENHSASLPPYWNYGLVAQVILDKEGAKLVMKSVAFDQATCILNSTEDDEFCKHIREVISILHDDKTYMEEVNSYCLRLQNLYDRAFSDSGYMKYDIKKFSKQVILKMVGREHVFSPVYIINNLQCEVHRWAILRAFKMKLNRIKTN